MAEGGLLRRRIGLRLRRLTLGGISKGLVPVPPATVTPTSTVTVIVPARNEERNIEACVRSLLNQGYPNYELIVVEGGSEDATPTILQRLAGESPRLKVMAEPPLPAGWVGKSWALTMAVEQVESQWLLFTDADTEHQPGALAAAVAFAESHGVDMLSFLHLTSLKLVTFWERVLLPAIFGLVVQVGGSPEEVNDPDSPVAKANGQFTLIRRAVYEAVGRHEPIKGELAEEMFLAKLVKGKGYRIFWADGRNWMKVRQYRSLGGIWEAFTRAVFVGAFVNRSLARLLVGAVLLLALAWGFFALAGLGLFWLATGSRGLGPWLVVSLGGLGILAQVGRGVRLAKMTGIPAAYGLLHPLGISVLVAMMLNSAFRVLSGRGVTWKGRRYLRRVGDPSSS